jgi:hypothetical protein
MSRFGQPEVYIPLHGYIVGETLKAILFQVVRGEKGEVEEHNQKKVWFPISQTQKTIRPAQDSDELATIFVKEWIWKAKIQDEWGGRDPLVVSGPVSTKPAAANSLEDEDPFFGEEGPPW